MAVEIAQSTRVICAQGFEFRDRIRDSDVDFRDIKVRKRLVDQDLEVRQFRTRMGGVTDNIAQSALDSVLRRSRRGRVCRGGLVLIGCPLASFAFLSWSCHHRGRVLGRCRGPGGNGGSEGDRLNRCQSKVGFGVTGWGSGWRVKVPDGYAQGQVREREGGHDGDRIDSGRGNQERYLTSGIMTRRDGSEMVKAWGNRSRGIKGFRDTSCRRRARRRRSGWWR